MLVLNLGRAALHSCYQPFFRFSGFSHCSTKSLEFIYHSAFESVKYYAPLNTV